MFHSYIKNINALETFSPTGESAVTVKLETEAGTESVALFFDGIKFGNHYGEMLFDKDEKRFEGRGMKKAAEIINTILAPALIGKDASNRTCIDNCIIDAMRVNNLKPYVNVTSPVSVACMKVAAEEFKLPLYRYLGGSRSYTIPVSGAPIAKGSNRYLPCSFAKKKPYYGLIAYGFDNLEDANYAIWTVQVAWRNYMKDTWHMGKRVESIFYNNPAEKTQDDRQIFEGINEVLEKLNLKNKIGLHADLSATAYYNSQTNTYKGLFCAEELSRDQVIDRIIEMVEKYNFVKIQEPLQCEDLEGYRFLTKNTGIAITSADIFGNDLEKLEEVALTKCINEIALQPNSFYTTSDCIKAARIASKYGIKIMPIDNFGEGNDIIDYAVGFHCNSLYMNSPNDHSNRLRTINCIIGKNSMYFGMHGLAGDKFSLAKVIDNENS